MCFENVDFFKAHQMELFSTVKLLSLKNFLEWYIIFSTWSKE